MNQSCELESFAKTHEASVITSELGLTIQELMLPCRGRVFIEALTNIQSQTNILPSTFLFHLQKFQQTIPHQLKTNLEHKHEQWLYN